MLVDSNYLNFLQHEIRNAFSFGDAQVARVALAEKNVLLEQVRIAISVEGFVQRNKVCRACFIVLDQLNRPTLREMI